MKTLITRLLRTLRGVPRLFWPALAVFAALVASNTIATSGARQALDDIARLGALRNAVRTTVLVGNDAQTQLRSYMLAGDAHDRDAYAHSAAQSREELAEITRAQGTTEDPETAALLRRLSHAYADLLGELAAMARLHDAGDQAAWQHLIATPESRQRLDEARSAALAITEHLDALQDAAGRRVLATTWISRASLFVVGLVALASFYLYLRQAARLRRHAARQQALIREDRDRLDRLARQRTTALAELATHLQNVREDERAHLARELHDELGALLTAAKLDVARLKSRLPSDADAAERLAHLGATLDRGIALKRDIIENLRPSTLSNLGLAPALEILLQEFSRRTGVAVRADIEPGQDLPEAVSLTVYRLLQEACTNIAKYAHARHVTVRVATEAGTLHVNVQDDGVGFDADAVPRRSHGLYGMRHRVEALGGRLAVESHLGSGTRLAARIPLTTAPAQPL